jgi:hypothetical protein
MLRRHHGDDAIAAEFLRLDRLVPNSPFHETKRESRIEDAVDDLLGVTQEYIGGTEVPARHQYCTLEPSANRSVATPQNALILRSRFATARGPWPSRITEVEPTAKSVVRDIERIESDLVQSLPHPQPVMPVDYSN